LMAHITSKLEGLYTQKQHELCDLHLKENTNKLQQMGKYPTMINVCMFNHKFMHSYTHQQLEEGKVYIFEMKQDLNLKVQTIFENL
jgi:hypothetical protein